MYGHVGHDIHIPLSNTSNVFNIIHVKTIYKGKYGMPMILFKVPETISIPAGYFIVPKISNVKRIVSVTSIIYGIKNQQYPRYISVADS